MKLVVSRTNKKSGEVRYLAGKPTNWPDDHVSHGSLLADDIEKAHYFSSYPDAVAAAGVIAAQTGTEDFNFEVVEAA
jgi:hypothetical protein